MTGMLRAASRFVIDLVAYGWRTGRWWMPIVTVLLLLVTLLLATVKVVVPTTVYTLF